jgi:hypothetical protein
LLLSGHRRPRAASSPRRKDVSAEAIVYGTRRDSTNWEFSYYVIDIDRAGNCENRGGTPDPLPGVTD